MGDLLGGDEILAGIEGVAVDPAAAGSGRRQRAKPSPLGWGSDRRAPRPQQIGERVGVERTGQHAAATDDRDWVGRHRPWGRHADRLFGDANMRIEPADPERRDGGGAGSAGRLPRLRLLKHADGQGVPVDTLAGLLEPDRRRSLTAVHRQQNLDQADQASRLERVPEVGLRRPDRQRLPPTGLPHQATDRLQLGCVAERGAGRVTFEQVDRQRRLAIAVGPADRKRLPFLAGGPQRAAAAIRRNAQRGEHTEDRQPRRFGLGERDDDAGNVAFRRDQPAGAAVERSRRLSAAGLRLREQDQVVDGVVGRAADDRGVDSPGPQRQASLLEGDQRRGARGIDHLPRAGQPQRLGDERGRGVSVEPWTGPVSLRHRVAVGTAASHLLDQLVGDAVAEGGVDPAPLARTFAKQRRGLLDRRGQRERAAELGAA